ncbi:YcxB family protein [Sinanaerobacter sp. ZZT-01]|uniref:YcxB family protein n=1 Tax=Sinanaerobacter sp. ZZT-01 TaxID=3111540 RepID=UPI002D789717|nr:YcxB family protein [Sinanaerobacter sp. ZZT-01]WRR93047.1 YcxB family protein [Sinanaerobacter sp. ZZT-01]
MQELPLFRVKTTMEKEDYRNFLYFATFRKNIFTIPMMFLLSGLGALLGRYLMDHFEWKLFFLAWICLLGLMLAVLCYKVEWKKKRRIQTDNTGTFGSSETISFYKDYLISESSRVEGRSKLRYDQFYRVYSSKSYLILYYNETMASLIRKKDMDQSTCRGIETLLREQFKERFRTV